MDSTICPGCQQSIIPIRIFEKSKKRDQWWRITKCPRERCGFNIDLEECDKPGRAAPTDNAEPDKSDDGRSFWRYGL